MDFDNLGAGPDIDNIDTSTMDLGNEVTDGRGELADDGDGDLQLPVTKVEDGKTADETKGEDEGKAADEAKAKTEAEEASRDEKGRFTGKGVIPVERHKATLDKEREARAAAERRAAELERRLNEKEATQTQNVRMQEIEATIEGMEAKHAELLLDGKTAEASALMRQIRHMERDIAAAEAESRAVARTSQAIEAERFDLAVARLEADYTAFNPDSEAYDPDLVQLVLAKQTSLMQSEGLSPSKAIEKAAKDVAARFLKKEDPAPEPKGLAAGAGDDRKKAAIAKAIETQNAQAPSTKEVGMDSDKFGEKGLPDVSKMSADEFAALPQSTQDRLMGNLV